MEILMFSSFFYPHIGGVEKHVQRLCEELVNNDYKVTIITQRYDTKLPNFEILNQIQIYRIDKKLPNSLSSVFKQRNLIKNADLIHFHDFSTFIYWYLPFRFLYPCKKVFITYHGYEGIIPIPRNIFFMRKMSEYLTKGNICIGDYITKWYKTKADIISYGGVDPILFSFDNITSVDKSLAVFIGRLEEDTGIMEYIKSIKILKHVYNIDIKLDICGDGSLKDYIESYAKQNNLNIYLHGFVRNTDSYLMKSDMAFVSGYLAILEAMISKKLVFSIYKNQLKKDYLFSIPDTSNLINIASSSQELSEQILYFYENPDKIKIKTENAYKFARDQTWEKVANAYINLWGIKNE